MPNLEIASVRLREIVSDLEVNGLPAVFTNINELTEDQINSYRVLAQAHEEFNKTVDSQAFSRGESPKPGTTWWNGCLAFRKALQVAIEADLLRGPMVQENMFDFGAVPDPEFKWKWCYDFDGGAYCWECGSTILEKTAPIAHVHGRKGDFIGTVGGEKSGYCPKCDG